MNTYDDFDAEPVSNWVTLALLVAGLALLGGVVALVIRCWP